MRLAVLGVGAIGGVIGGYLARGGRDVTLIDQWPANVECMKDQGLTITAAEEEFTVKVTAIHLGEVSAAQRLFDAVYLCVKSYDTAWATTFIQPHLAAGGFIVSAQNSINEDAIASVVGWPRVVGCVVTVGAGMYEPGHVERTSAATLPSFKIGEPSGMMSPRVEKLSQLMNDIGPTKTTTNLWGERWAKLATNSMSNPLAAITGLGSAELRQNPEVRALSIRIAAELVQVASALGVHIEPIGGIPAHMFQEALDDHGAMSDVQGLMMEAGKTIGTGRPSLAQDVIKGRKTEVEHLNGYVVAKGGEVGVPTPVNRSVVELTRRVEAGELESSLSNLKYIPSLPSGTPSG